MPTITLCERCEAPLDERMNWCVRCRTAPWAPATWAQEPVEVVDWPDRLDWPDIWANGNGHVTEETDPIQDHEFVPLSEMFASADAPRAPVFWSLRKALTTVALLIGLATLTAVYVPERVVGLVSLVSLGTIALLVVQRAWVSEPSEH